MVVIVSFVIAVSVAVAVAVAVAVQVELGLLDQRIYTCSTAGPWQRLEYKTLGLPLRERSLVTVWLHGYPRSNKQ